MCGTFVGCLVSLRACWVLGGVCVCVCVSGGPAGTGDEDFHTKYGRTQLEKKGGLLAGSRGVCGSHDTVRGQVWVWADLGWS